MFTSEPTNHQQVNHTPPSLQEVTQEVKRYDSDSIKPITNYYYYII